MTEKELGPAKQQDIRIIDRRSFTSEGDRREPDASGGESAGASPDAAGVAPRPADPPGAESSPTTDSRSAESDPVASAHFQNLVLNLAQQAAAQLGAAKSPLTGQVEIDIDAAQHIIDLLNALEQKTRGNLSREEREMLEGLIGDLQMQYVTVRSRTQKTS